MASIEQRGDRYRVVWRFEGAKQYTTWPSLEFAAEAQGIVDGHRGKIAADRVYADMGVLEPVDDELGMTFREWAEQWLPSKTRISAGTRARYQQQLRDHIYPEFGDVPLTKITAIQIGTWLNEMTRIMGSPKTVTRYYSVLFTALDAAVDHGALPINPCKAVDYVRDRRADDDTGEHHAVYLRPQDYELLRTAFPDRWHPLLDTIVETGLRWSEVTALAAKHLVPPSKGKRARLLVWRAWKEAKGVRYLGTTKGRSKRSLPIGGDLYKTLHSLVDGMPDDTLIFRQDDGAALEYDATYDKVWTPALLRARRCPTHPPLPRGEVLAGARGRCRDYGGVKEDDTPCGALVVKDRTRCVRHVGVAPDAVSACACPGVLRSAPSWHDLRHTHAAWLFSDPRMTPLAISRRLGHQQLATTSEIYGDLMPEAEELAVDAVADARRTGRVGVNPPSGRAPLPGPRLPQAQVDPARSGQRTRASLRAGSRRSLGPSESPRVPRHRVIRVRQV